MDIAVGQGIGPLGELALHHVELGQGAVGLGVGAAGERVPGHDLGQDRAQALLPGEPPLADLEDLLAALVGAEAVHGHHPAARERQLVQRLDGERRRRPEIPDLDRRQVPPVDRQGRGGAPLAARQLVGQHAGGELGALGLEGDAGREIAAELVAAQHGHRAQGVGQLLEQGIAVLEEEGDVGRDLQIGAVHQPGRERVAALRQVMHRQEGAVAEHRPGGVGEVPPPALVDQLGGEAAAKGAWLEIAGGGGAPLVEPEAPAIAEAGGAGADPGMVGDQLLGARGLEVGRLDLHHPQQAAGRGQDGLTGIVERQQPGQPVGQPLVPPPEWSQARHRLTASGEAGRAARGPAAPRRTGRTG